MPGLVADRSWLLRGHAHPTPTWGLSASPLLDNATFTFTRRVLVDDGYGGNKGGGPQIVWVTPGNVQQEAQSRKKPDPEGPAAHAVWTSFVRNPVDQTLRPRKGDMCSFIDSLGKPHVSYVAEIEDPSNEFDHLELMLEEQI